MNHDVPRRDRFHSPLPFQHGGATLLSQLPPPQKIVSPLPEQIVLDCILATLSQIDATGNESLAHIISQYESILQKRLSQIQ